MKLEEIIIRLKDQNFYRANFLEDEILEKLRKLNIDIWMNNSRLIMIKEYRTQSDFLEWNETDQLFVSTVLSKIPNKFLNNFYYFILMNFNSDDIKIKLEINKIEKNELIFKKYVIINYSDLERIPFLNDFKLKSEQFSFDEKFRKKMSGFSSDIPDIVDDLIDFYFENYSSNNTDLSQLEDINDVKFKKILKIGE